MLRAGNSVPIGSARPPAFLDGGGGAQRAATARNRSPGCRPRGPRRPRPGPAGPPRRRRRVRRRRASARRCHSAYQRAWRRGARRAQAAASARPATRGRKRRLLLPQQLEARRAARPAETPPATSSSTSADAPAAAGGEPRALRDLVLLLPMTPPDAAVVLAPRVEEVGKRGDRVALREAQPQVVVLGALHRLVVATERAHGFGAHHHRAVHDAVAPAQPAAQRLAVDRGVDDADLRAEGVDAAGAARDERDPRMGVEERDLALEALGRAEIVGVHRAPHSARARARGPGSASA